MALAFIKSAQDPIKSFYRAIENREIRGLRPQLKEGNLVIWVCYHCHLYEVNIEKRSGPRTVGLIFVVKVSIRATIRYTKAILCQQNKSWWLVSIEISGPATSSPKKKKISKPAYSHQNLLACTETFVSSWVSLLFAVGYVQQAQAFRLLS